MQGTEPHVVIVGGGFGGLLAARGLRKAPVRVTVIDRANHHLFQPLLYQVATAALAPADIAQPIRDVLGPQKNTEVLMAEVVGVDKEKRIVQLTDREIPYDYLVLAVGAHYNYFGHDEWEKYAPSLKSLSDALSIRESILMAFEAAEMEPDPVRQQALLTFVLVGGGPTGVEMAGSIAELAYRGMSADFKHIRTEWAKVLLVEAGPEVLGTFPPRLAAAAHKELVRLGVTVRTNAKVELVDEEGVIVGGERIESRNVIWTAGVAANPAAKWLGTEADRGGRVKVKEDLSVPELPNVFVIGDAAFVEHKGKPLPGIAPVAMQEGRYVARLLQDRLAGRAVAPFRYKEKGNLATVGRAFAILDWGRWQMAGLLTWLLWVMIHIWYLIGFRNRLVVMLQWMWAYVTYERASRLISSERTPQTFFASKEEAQPLPVCADGTSAPDGKKEEAPDPQEAGTRI